MFSYILIGFVFAAFQAVVHSATPYKDCGSGAGTIQAFQVTNCDKAPCVFVKGNTYAMNLTFQAKAASKASTVSIHGIIAGVPVPFPIPVSDGCKLGLKCPVNSGDVNLAQLSLAVLSSYPSISLYAKIEVGANDAKEDYVCLQFPATITGSNSHARLLDSWKEGQLF